MVHKQVSLLLTFALLSLGVAAAADKTGFAGKWELDKKKSAANGGPEELQQDISLKGSNLVIKSKYVEPKNAVYPLMWVGIMTYELPLTVDGTEKVNQIGPFMHTSKTTMEGTKMTTDFNATMEGGSVTGQWIRNISPDGKEMTLQIVEKASDGRTMDQTLYFRRK